MQNKSIKILFGILLSSLFVSCGSVKYVLPKEKKPFQEKSFDSKLWREGDAQARGEMSKDLLWNKSEPEGYLLSRKTREEVSAILGEPDRKTRGRCCGAGGTSNEEVWLYNLEVQDAGDSKIRNEHFQLYFSENGKVDTTRISVWDDKNPDYYPRIG